MPSPPQAAALSNFYIELLDEGWNPTERASWLLVRPEITNLRTILMDMFKLGQHTPKQINAAIWFTKWTQYINDLGESVIDAALALQKDDELCDWAGCYECKAGLLLCKDDLAGAEVALEKSRELYRQCQNVLGEANSTNSLGYLFIAARQAH